MFCTVAWHMWCECMVWCVAVTCVADIRKTFNVTLMLLWSELFPWAMCYRHNLDVQRNAWMCVCCVQSVGCPWRLTTCMWVHSCFHQCPDASSMLYWWPVCGTPEDTSSDVASCRFLPGWSRVGQSSHAPRKKNVYSHYHNNSMTKRKNNLSIRVIML